MFYVIICSYGGHCTRFSWESHSLNLTFLKLKKEKKKSHDLYSYFLVFETVFEV